MLAASKLPAETLLKWMKDPNTRPTRYGLYGLMLGHCGKREDAKAIRDSLQSKAVVVTAKAGESGRLFGAVTTAEIADAVKKSGAPQIDKRKVEIGQPIKALGEYQVSVRLHADVAATVTVKVVAA